jgi:hypothetical protein
VIIIKRRIAVLSRRVNAAINLKIAVVVVIKNYPLTK